MFFVALFFGLLCRGNEVSIITRKVGINNTIQQEEALCGETLSHRVSVFIDSEPGTERRIYLEFASNVPWVTVKGTESEFSNEVTWFEYVKRVELVISLAVTLKVPGCEPSTDISISIKGTFDGGTCEEDTTVCQLTMPEGTIAFVTQLPS